MRAAVIKGHGSLDQVAVIDNLPVPELTPGQVLIKVMAAALNRLDLWVLEGWPGLHLEFPHVIGSDAAGVVDAIGSDVDGFQPGDRVCIDPSIIPPGDPALKSGMENQTRSLRILGEHLPGVAAEYVAVPSRNLLKVPNHVSCEQAAAAGLVYVTAWHSLVTRGRLQPGETVLIVGAGGGVNSASIQIAKHIGATVYVVGSNDEKCKLAADFGADATFNRADDPDWAKAVYKLTEKRGVDVVVDNVGRATFNDSMRSLNIGGRMLVVGNTSGPKVEIDIRQIFGRQISIIGSTMGPHQDYITVMNLVFEGALSPAIAQILPLEGAQEAMTKLKNFELFGKVVLQVNSL